MKYRDLLRKAVFVIFFQACCLSAVLFAQGETAQGKMSVLKTGSTVYIRSRFSGKEDLVLRVSLGANRQINFAGTYLLDSSLPMTVEALQSGKGIHGNGDDACPWHLNGTYIGGNHGAAVGWEVTSEGHGRTVEDIGTQWEDSHGNKFYLFKIAEKSLFFVGENTSKDNIWKIGRRLEGDILSNSKNIFIKFTDKKLYQVKPACRIKKQEYLVNGKVPLKDNEAVSCEWLDIVEEYDIINMGSLLADVIAHPGQKRDFTAEHLEGVVRNNITYRFSPNGSNVIYYRARALQEFRLGYMGFIQSSKLNQGSYKTHEYYIPKTIPFIKNGVNYNFRNIHDYSSRLPVPLAFSERDKNISDLENLPERFIQFLGNKDGDKTVREVGYALGYSLIHGITVPSVRAKNTGNSITLYTSNKSYPNAVNSKMGPMIPEGTEFYCIAYRHYFDPREAGNATCLYWQKHENDTVVYADYHKSVDKDILRLPSEFTGKKVEVVEKTESAVLHTKGTVPAKGLEVSIRDGYGYMVLKLY